MKISLALLLLALAALVLPAQPSNSPAPLHQNTLGMKFAPVPGLRVQFCLWETRVADFQKFLDATERPWTAPDFEQSPAHPVVNVTWDDASAFCDWLTKKERQEGKLTAKGRYRLPYDTEWTAAAAFPSGEGNTPEARLKNSVVWPWGHYWPPLADDGNFGPVLKTDRYEFTSPVGSFKPNRFGFFDLGGNVWEWCEDWYNQATVTKTLRGGSFNDTLPQYLLVSYRFSATMNLSNDDIGFRVVFESGE